MSIGTMVQTPWPISEWLTRTVTDSSAPMRRKALTIAPVASGAASARYGRAFQGSAKPMTSPPVTSRNPRRVNATMKRSLSRP